MYTLIIFVILTILIIYVVGKQSNPFDYTVIPGAILGMAFLYIVVIGIGRVSYANKHNLNTEEYRDLPIVSFSNKDGWNINGTFILGTGGVNGGSYTYYVTYGKFSQGLKRMELSTNRYYLKETNSKSPCIPKYWEFDIKKEYKSKWWWNRKYSKDQYMRENYDAKTIIIPTNTVFKHFDVKD